MSYQGMRARAADDESTRVFEVSKVRLAAQGQVSHVLWAEVNARTAHDVSPRDVAPVAEVIDAMHGGARLAAVFTHPGGRRPERFFAVTQHEDGTEAIVLDGAPSPGHRARRPGDARARGSRHGPSRRRKCSLTYRPATGLRQPWRGATQPAGCSRRRSR